MSSRTRVVFQKTLGPLLPSRVAFFVFIVLLTACEAPFEPLEDNDFPFSLTGYLDPSADTQWVRVMPFRESVQTSVDPIDAVVTLEELETGKQIEMNYRVRVLPSPVLQDGEFKAHNFWTDEPILVGHTYRLTATRSDGVSSGATIPIPENDFTTIHVRDFSPGIFHRDRLHISGISSLAFVFNTRTVPTGCDDPLSVHFQYQLILERPELEENPYIASLRWSPTGRPSYVSDPPDCSPLPLGPLRHRVVASGSPWPFNAQITDIEFSHPSIAGNVENGVGFVPGLLSKDYPHQSCTLLDPSRLTCEIVYSPISARIEGSVFDACEGGGVPGGTVSLVEVAGRWAIGVGLEEDGSFRVEGLDPGQEYQLQVSAAGYPMHEGEMLVLNPQEARTLPHIILNPSEGC